VIPSASVGPVRSADRFETIDTLRGFALLGILLMNIPSFGLVSYAYSNPNYGGGNDLLNRWTLTLVYLFGEGKMRAIFSMMFGASALLLIGRGEAKGGGIEVADVYYRRTLWLLLFGMIHGYLIWWGDILFPYAMMGLILFPLRKLSARTLIVVAALQLAVLTASFTADAFDTKEELAKYEQVKNIDAAKLTKEQKEQKEKGEKKLKELKPKPERIQEELDNYRGHYFKNMKERAAETWNFHRFPIYFPFLWDILSFMFLGMALLKTGVLTGDWSDRFYIQMAWIGGALGLVINGSAMWLQWRHDFDSIQGMFDGLTYEAGRAPMALCYVSLLILLCKRGAARWLTSRLAAVGQMAFSNYISHSLICSTLFYGGYGFGLIGRLQRWQLYAIVLAIWIFNLTWSPWWLKRYYFGPLEWCWRSLTYWKRQPFRIQPDPPSLPRPEAPSLEETPRPALDPK
jgi:uncharacterized protein